MTLITFTVLPFLAVASVVLFPIVNDRIDDPVGISVRHATQVASFRAGQFIGRLLNMLYLRLTRKKLW